LRDIEQLEAVIVGIAATRLKHDPEHALRPVCRIGLVAEPVGHGFALDYQPFLTALFQFVEITAATDHVVYDSETAVLPSIVVSTLAMKCWDGPISQSTNAPYSAIRAQRG